MGSTDSDDDERGEAGGPGAAGFPGPEPQWLERRPEIPTGSPADRRRKRRRLDDARAGCRSALRAAFVSRKDRRRQTSAGRAFDAGAGTADYVRVTPGSRMGTVSVRARAAGDGTTEAAITYRLTALSPEGNRKLEEMTPPAYDAMLRQWEVRIEAKAGLHRG